MLVRALMLAAAAVLIVNSALADWKNCLDLRSAARTAYIVTDRDGQTSCGDMNDNLIDAEARAAKDDSLWFRLDTETWVVRDPGVVASAQRQFAKVNEIGARQGAIGAKQGRIGAEQGVLGARQAALAISRMGSTDAPKDDPAEAEARSARMRELGEQMEGLGKIQSALAEDLKRELNAAQAGLSKILDQAIKDGTAVRVRRL
jgi:hypothetical protein